MAEIISFSKARKNIKKAEKETKSIRNRAKFGRRKSDVETEKSRENKRNKDLDDHKIDD